MLAKFNVFFTGMIFFEAIQYNIKGAAGQVPFVPLEIFFTPTYIKPNSFIKNQLGPVFEDLSKCLDWKFYPVYFPHHDNNIDKLYQCAYDQNMSRGYELAKFYVCMITGDDHLSQGESCATKAKLDWASLNACKSSVLHFKLNDGETLGIYLNAETDINFATNFKDTVCAKLKELSVSCPSCPL